MRVSPDQLGAWAAAPSSSSVSVRRRARWQAATQMSLGFVSELCQIPPETPVRHRDLRGHVDAHRCCGKSLIRSALVGFGVRQHARRESISKRARSTTPTSLRFRINNLWSLNVLDSANCDKSSNVSRSLTGFSSIAAPLLLARQNDEAHQSCETEMLETSKSGSTAVCQTETRLSTNLCVAADAPD